MKDFIEEKKKQKEIKENEEKKKESWKGNHNTEDPINSFANICNR